MKASAEASGRPVACAADDASFSRAMLALVRRAEDLGLGHVRRGVRVEEVGRRAVGLVPRQAGARVAPARPAPDVREVERGERAAVVALHARHGVGVGVAEEGRQGVAQLVAVPAREGGRDVPRPARAVVLERVVELRAQRRSRGAERRVEHREVPRERVLRVRVEHQALAARRRALDLLAGAGEERGVQRPLAGRRRPLQRAVRSDTGREVLPLAGRRGDGRGRDHSPAVERVGGERRSAGDADLPHDERARGVLAGDGRSAERPAGAGREVDGHAEAPGLGARVRDEADEARREKRHVAALLADDAVDGADLDAAEAGSRERLQLARQALLVDRAAQPPPARPRPAVARDRGPRQRVGRRRGGGSCRGRGRRDQSKGAGGGRPRAPRVPHHARHQTKATVFDSAPICGHEIVTTSPGSRPTSSGWMMPVPVESTVPVRIVFERSRKATISSYRRLSCAVEASPRNTSAPARTTRHSSLSA